MPEPNELSTTGAQLPPVDAAPAAVVEPVAAADLATAKADTLSAIQPVLQDSETAVPVEPAAAVVAPTEPRIETPQIATGLNEAVVAPTVEPTQPATEADAQPGLTALNSVDFSGAKEEAVVATLPAEDLSGAKQAEAAPAAPQAPEAPEQPQV